MSLYTQLYHPSGSSRMAAYLRRGKVVHPKDITQNGHLAVDFGKGDVVEFSSASFVISDNGREKPWKEGTSERRLNAPLPLAQVSESMAKAFGMNDIPGVTEVVPDAVMVASAEQREKEKEYKEAKAFIDSHIIIAHITGPTPVPTPQRVSEVVAEKQATWRQVRYIQILTGRMYKMYELSRDEASKIITDALKQKETA